MISGPKELQKPVSQTVPENDLALEVGEFFYQLRAALDSLIYQASVYSEGLDPPSNQDKVEFPICIDEGKFNRNAVNKPPFPAPLRDWILSIQPYVARDPAHPHHELSRYLEILHDCARFDRHSDCMWRASLASDVSPGVNVTGIEHVPGNILQHEDVFLRFKVDSFNSSSPKKIKLKSHFALQIAVEYLPTPEGSDMGKEMMKILKAVDVVIQFFRDGFSGSVPEEYEVVTG